MNDKKKVVLTQEKLKDLKGFEEVMDLLFDEKKVLSNQEIRANKDDTFEIYSFLEKEIARLKQLDHFFSHQIRTHEFYSQTSVLCEKQTERIADSKSKITQILKKENSPLQVNLSHLFEKTF
ncbi:MAG: hypothetical protein Fur0010_01980 [Bdellovibrio sp.]